jgi:cytochrome c oxidase cbb3-type subunit 4
MDLKLFHEILRSAWTAIAVVTFVAIVAWAFWPGNRAKFDQRARIPLDER